MTKYLIAIELQSEIQRRVDIFCQKEIPDCPCRHIADARGKFIYIQRLFPDNRVQKIGRLTYEGNIDDMKFAIFKFSTEKYHFGEFFPGMEELNGTMEGAIRAGLEAYPVNQETESHHFLSKIILEVFGFFK